MRDLYFFSITVFLLLSSCIRTNSNTEKNDAISEIENLINTINSEYDDSFQHPKDTIDFDAVKISKDSLDLKLFNLLNEYKSYSEDKLLENIEVLIKKGANPDAVIEYQYSVRKAGTYIPIVKHFYNNKYRTYTANSTAFLEAVSIGRYNVVNKMIVLGAGVNTPSRSAVFPLDIALKKDYTKIIDLLLEKGANPRYVDLSLSSNIDEIERMVKLGADIQTVDINFALENEQVLKRILALKPNVNKTKFDYKIIFGNEKILDILLEAGLDNTARGKFPDGDPLIFGAIKYGDINTIKKLKNAGIDIMYKGSKSTSDSPFLEVVKSKKVDLTKYYIEQGANTNEKDWTERSALIFAVNTDSDEIIKLLIDAGANIEYAGYFNKTPLMQAVDYNKYIAASTLINEGANVNYKNKYHESCLSTAVKEANLPMIKLLIENGADKKTMLKKMNMVEYAKSVDAPNMIIDYLENL